MLLSESTITGFFFLAPWLVFAPVVVGVWLLLGLALLLILGKRLVAIAA